MDSVFNKENLFEIAQTSPQGPGQASDIKLLLALIEIREAIEEGFKRLDQTSIEASMMLVGCKETFDSFVAHRLESDKVLQGLASDLLADGVKIREMLYPPDEPVDKPEKSAETLEVGGISRPVGDSGIS